MLQGWITDSIAHVAPPLESTETNDQDIQVAYAAKLFVDAVLAFAKTVQDSPLTATTESYPHTDPPAAAARGVLADSGRRQRREKPACSAVSGGEL